MSKDENKMQDQEELCSCKAVPEMGGKAKE